MSKISVDLALCTGCGSCVVTCAENIFIQPEPGKPPEIRHEEFCIDCGHCAAMCPEGAIRHAAYSGGSILPLHPDKTPNTEQVFEMLRQRRSVRLFKKAPLDREIVPTIIEGARLAPSAHNLRQTEYIVVQDENLRDEVVTALGSFYGKLARQLKNPIVRTLYRLTAGWKETQSVLHMVPDFEMVATEAKEGKDPFLHRAPCVIVAHAEKSLNFPEANAFLALHNATFVAQALGVYGFLAGYLIGACQREKSIPKMMGVPEGHVVYGALALGYPTFDYKKWIQRPPVKITWR